MVCTIEQEGEVRCMDCQELLLETGKVQIPLDSDEAYRLGRVHGMVLHGHKCKPLAKEAGNQGEILRQERKLPPNFFDRECDWHGCKQKAVSVAEFIDPQALEDDPYTPAFSCKLHNFSWLVDDVRQRDGEQALSITLSELDSLIRQQLHIVNNAVKFVETRE